MAHSQKLNILILVDEFFGGRGGTEQHILFLLGKLPRELFKVHLVVLTRICHYDPAAFPVEPVFLRNGCRAGVGGAIQRLRRLASYITSNKIDVVHAFSPISELSAIVSTRLARCGRVLGVRRNTGYWHTPSTLWQARLVRFLGAMYVANCEAAKQCAVRAEWIPSHRCVVIRNPLVRRRMDHGLRTAMPRQSLGIVDGEQVVGIVANVRPVKDHATFVHAARLVLDRCPRTRFLVVGWQEPETFARLQSLVATLKMDEQVSWLGTVPNPFSVLPHFDVGVLSSVSEGFSNSLLEYAAAGVAAVATDVGGTREVVEDGVTGLLVPPRSPGELADAICRLLQDDQLRSRLARNAQARATALFSEEAILDEYARLYLRLTGHPLVSVCQTASNA